MSKASEWAKASRSVPEPPVFRFNGITWLTVTPYGDLKVHNPLPNLSAEGALALAAWIQETFGEVRWE